MTSSILVFLGAGIGGLLRHVLNAWITRLAGSDFPFGILAVNVLGCLAMGVLAGWFAFRGQLSHEWQLFLTTGLLGGFTTFSAFSLDTALLFERGEPELAALYVAGSVLLSVMALFLGLYAMRGA